MVEAATVDRLPAEQADGLKAAVAEFVPGAWAEDGIGATAVGQSSQAELLAFVHHAGGRVRL